MLLPEGVERLVKAFARQPTPSASALQKVLDENSIIDLDVTGRCFGCGIPVRCPQEWVFCEDGAVGRVYHMTHCDRCGEENDDVYEEEVCEGLSAKSTWEICWENARHDCDRLDEVRKYVLERLQAYED